MSSPARPRRSDEAAASIPGDTDNQPVDRARNATDFAPFLAAAALALTLLVFVPTHVYLSNKSDLRVFLREVLLCTGTITVALTLAFTGALALIPRNLRKRITVLLLGLTSLFWIHAYALTWPFEVMDGRTIPWDTFTGRTVIDATLWIVVLTLAQWQVNRIYRRAKTICLGLLAMQLASTVVTSVSSYDTPLDFFKNYYVEKDSVLDFSREKNVILIVLDEFQSDIFSDTILNSDVYRDNFKGFTYFPNTLAGFNFTEFALPAILTGRIYDNGTPRHVFLQKSYLDHSLPAMLKRSEMAVHLYPWRGFANESIYYDEAVASNFKRRPQPWANKFVDVARLLDLSLFRSAPQFAKRTIYNHARWRILDWLKQARARERLLRSAALSSDTQEGPGEIGPEFTLDNFFINLARGEKVAGGKITTHESRPAFKFYHLAGLHAPVKLTRDLEWGIFNYTRANYSEQAEAYAIVLGRFFEALKKNDLYDRSMIIVVGDHGSGRSPELYVNPGTSARTSELNRTANSGIFQYDKARGIPLLLVKRFGEEGALKSSRVPASLVDIPATILAELKIAHAPAAVLPGQDDFLGESLFALQENQTRVRYYGAMTWAEEKSDFVNPIALYRVQGDSWSDDSWSFAKTLEPKK